MISLIILSQKKSWQTRWRFYLLWDFCFISWLWGEKASIFCGVNVSYTVRQNIQLIRCHGESCMCFFELLYPLTKPPTVFNVDRPKCKWVCSLEFCGKYIIWLCKFRYFRLFDLFFSWCTTIWPSQHTSDFTVLGLGQLFSKRGQPRRNPWIYKWDQFLWLEDPPVAPHVCLSEIKLSCLVCGCVGCINSQPIFPSECHPPHTLKNPVWQRTVSGSYVTFCTGYYLSLPH